MISAAAAAAAVAAADLSKREMIFPGTLPGKNGLQKRKNTKKAKILYIFHIESLQDDMVSFKLLHCLFLHRMQIIYVSDIFNPECCRPIPFAKRIDFYYSVLHFVF